MAPRRYAPLNSRLAIAGDVTPAPLLAQLEQWGAEWARVTGQSGDAGQSSARLARQRYLVDRRTLVQTTLTLGVSPSIAAVQIRGR